MCGVCGNYEETGLLRFYSPSKGRYEYRNIDRCIYPLVKALNDAGIPTIASCCGHEKQPGVICLRDGRELLIAPDFATARRIEKFFPPCNESPDGEHLLRNGWVRETAGWRFGLFFTKSIDDAMRAQQSREFRLR